MCPIAAPQSWAELVDGTSQCDEPSCERYMRKVVVSVRDRLVTFLKGSSAVGDIKLLKGTLRLEQQEPFQIDRDTTRLLQTTKEHWRWEVAR